MTGFRLHDHDAFWTLARAQHGVVTYEQLRRLGFSRHAIAQQIGTRRLHTLWPSVYAVGRPDVEQRGVWLAAVLACGPRAVLSHGSAGALWGVTPAPTGGDVDVSVPVTEDHELPGIRLRRRTYLIDAPTTEVDGVPVTTIADTLIDLAAGLSSTRLERAVNEADRRDLIDPEHLRVELSTRSGRHGAPALRTVLDRHTFTLTDSELEQRFGRIVQRIDLPAPVTQAEVNGFRVDFFWPGLGLVVETDGLRYHRTAAAQARDRLRDQAHTAAGLTALRFTHWQIRFERRHVEQTLAAVARRLAERS